MWVLSVPDRSLQGCLCGARADPSPQVPYGTYSPSLKPSTSLYVARDGHWLDCRHDDLRHTGDGCIEILRAGSAQLPPARFEVQGERPATTGADLNGSVVGPVGSDISGQTLWLRAFRPTDSEHLTPHQEQRHGAAAAWDRTALLAGSGH